MRTEQHPLYVLLLWHMHQPSYLDPETGVYSLPWVRLHGAKDYLRMAEIVAEHPGVHCVFNVVPCLAEQIESYAAGTGKDRLSLMVEKPRWTTADKAEMLNLCFSAHYHHMIAPHRRYIELFRQREQAIANPDHFTDQDYRDLLAWFNLVWIDPAWQKKDPRVRELIQKERDFTLSDIETLHQVQRDIMGQTFDRYRQMEASGQIELSVSPWFHPILPLLIDNTGTWEPSDNQVRPAIPFRATEDAKTQIERSRQFYRQRFGHGAIGLWPSEGAISTEALSLAWQAGFRWAASDEAVLGRSLGRWFETDPQGFITKPRDLYRPYRLLVEGELGPSLFFRDHTLSDRVGFLYKDFPPVQAAEDLYHRLLGIRQRLNDADVPWIVSIILDGENAWESYEDQGDPFLHAFYERIERNPDQIRAVTASEYLALAPPHNTLAAVASGSWIRADFSTWIGDREHALAWDLLAQTRADLVEWQESHPHQAEESVQRAWQALYRAEGSDWFWWYSRWNRSEQDAMFDATFRANLTAVYHTLGIPVPGVLTRSIYHTVSPDMTRQPTAYIHPPLDASVRLDHAWNRAGVAYAKGSMGAMQHAEAGLQTLRVGHDPQHLYLRLETGEPFPHGGQVSIYFSPRPKQPAISYPIFESEDGTGYAFGWQIKVETDSGAGHLYVATDGEGWQWSSEVQCAVSATAVEVEVSLAALKLKLGDATGLIAVMEKEGKAQACLPDEGIYTFLLQSYDP